MNPTSFTLISLGIIAAVCWKLWMWMVRFSTLHTELETVNELVLKLPEIKSVARRQSLVDDACAKLDEVERKYHAQTRLDKYLEVNSVYRERRVLHMIRGCRMKLECIEEEFTESGD